MTQPTPIADDLVSFAARAHAAADAKRLPAGSAIPPVDRPELRFKVRLVGWSTAVIYWYFVHFHADQWWRHLIIQVSVSNNTGEPLEAGQVNAYKVSILKLVENQVRVFFPLHDDVQFKLDVRAPVPVVHPETRQVSYRTALAFHFLVPADSTEGMVGIGARGRAGTSGLVDAQGNPLRSTTYRNVADQAPTSPPPDNVLPMGRAARRRAARRDGDPT